jgi:addiction module RelB/DinJ family antitoxin
MDSDVKTQFDEFCSTVGMNPTTAFNMFARVVVREKRLPFEVSIPDRSHFEPLEPISLSEKKNAAQSLIGYIKSDLDYDEIRKGKLL